MCGFLPVKVVLHYFIALEIVNPVSTVMVISGDNVPTATEMRIHEL